MHFLHQRPLLRLLRTKVNVGKQQFTTITRGILKIGPAQRVTILDPIGRVVYDERNPKSVVDVSCLRSNIYFLQIKTQSQTKTEKIIILK